MSTTLNKILGGVIILFMITSSVFYIKNNSLERQNNHLSSEVTKLSDAVNTLSNENIMLKSLQSEADKIIESREQSHKDLTTLGEKTKGEILNIEKRKETTNVNQTSNSNNSLDADITRMLNSLCDRVRGSSCPPSL